LGRSFDRGRMNAGKRDLVPIVAEATALDEYPRQFPDLTTGHSAARSRRRRPPGPPPTMQQARKAAERGLDFVVTDAVK
jgi:hypothetical protein